MQLVKTPFENVHETGSLDPTGLMALICAIGSFCDNLSSICVRVILSYSVKVVAGGVLFICDKHHQSRES